MTEGTSRSLRWWAFLMLAAGSIAVGSASLLRLDKPFPGFLLTPDWHISGLALPGSWTGAKAHLEAGLQVLAIDTQPVTGSPRAMEARVSAGSLDRYHTVEVLAGTGTGRFNRSVVLVPVQEMKPHDWLLAFGLPLAAAFGALALAFLALIAGAESASARALAWCALAVGAVALAEVEPVVWGALRGTAPAAEIALGAALLRLDPDESAWWYVRLSSSRRMPGSSPEPNGQDLSTWIFVPLAILAAGIALLEAGGPAHLQIPLATAVAAALAHLASGLLTGGLVIASLRVLRLGSRQNGLPQEQTLPEGASQREALTKGAGWQRLGAASLALPAIVLWGLATYRDQVSGMACLTLLPALLSYGLPVWLGHRKAALTVKLQDRAISGVDGFQVTRGIPTSNPAGHLESGLEQRLEQVHAQDSGPARAQEARQSHTHETERQHELEQEVQASLMPKERPGIEGLDLAICEHDNTSSIGAFYDVLPIDAHRWGILLGQAAGPLIPAALRASAMLSYFRSAAPGTVSPGDLLSHVNNLLFLYQPASPVTARATYAVYDRRDRSLRIARAGLQPPVRVCKARGSAPSSGDRDPEAHGDAAIHAAQQSNGDQTSRVVEQVEAPELPEGVTALGLTADTAFPEVELLLQPGDMLWWRLPEAPDSHGTIGGSLEVEQAWLRLGVK